MTQQSIHQRSIYQRSVYQRSTVLASLNAQADNLFPKDPRNKHRLGEIAEARFVAKAEDLNFAVAKPWSTRNRYDFIVDAGNRLSRIQLKCTDSVTYGAYQVKAVCRIANTRDRSYTAEDIDHLVAYIVPRDIWYVIPIAELGTTKYLRLYPEPKRRRKPKWETYREAWHLLREPATNQLV